MNFITTNNEFAIVKAVEGSKRIDALQDKTPLLQIVSKWRLYIGLPKEDVSHELAIITEFIFKNYGHLTLAEVELAYELSASRKLDDCEFFGYFSPMYVGKVLSAYLYHRKVVMTDAVRRKEIHDIEQDEKKNKPTPEEHCKITKDIFKDFYIKYKEEGRVDDILNICYNFLRKIEVLNPDKKMVDEAMSYGKDLAMKESKGTFKELIRSSESTTKIHARNYCVQKYFDGVSLDELLQKIELKHFI